MSSESLYISDDFKSSLARAGFSAETVFTNPSIICWRKLDDRENCTWDLPAENGSIRLHVKRYYAPVASEEAEGYRALELHDIPTAKLVAWGNLPDGRSFLITQDLAGYKPADKLIDSEKAFDRLLFPTADLASKLHNEGLHHRDLYLCHFFAKIEENKIDLRLIDAARVRPLPIFFRNRWLIKDLAQFWYSTLSHPISNHQREAWLARYASGRRITDTNSLQKSIERKSTAIAAHDVKLRQKQPKRNISIPGSETAI